MIKTAELKRVCEQCGNEFRITPSRANTARFCSRKCYWEWRRRKNSIAKINKVCEVCGKSFFIKPSRRGARFCSLKCQVEWQSEHLKGENNSGWESVDRICQTCGKHFFARPSAITLGGGIFCSRECYGKSKRGENHPKWKGGEVERVCETCGNPFFASQDQIKKGGGRFCSLECRGKWQSKHLIGENSAGWNGGPSKCVCQTCGKFFFRDPSVVKNGNGKFCSLSCARKARKGFPQSHTEPELIWQGIVIDKHSLPFKYTGDGSFWIGDKPAINPDFIHLTKKIVVEIFSYWHDPLRRHCKVRYSATYEGRKKILKRYGYKLIVFWQEDLEREDAEQFVLHTLREEGVIK